MKLSKKKKRVLIAGTAVVLAAAIGVGTWLGVRSGGDPVDVYPFIDVGMTEYWGDNQESYGPVRTDKIQTVVLSDTQTVTDILVKEGDQVKEGDVLMTFDTTLTELELERKRLAVEKQKLDLKTAKAELERIRSMKPMDPNAEPPVLPEPELGRPINGDYEISQAKGNDGGYYDGSQVHRPLILWLKDGKPLTNELLNLLWQTSQEYRKDAPPTEPEETTAPTQSSASAMPGDPMTAAEGGEDGADSEDPELLPEPTVPVPTQDSQPTEPSGEQTESPEPPATEQTQPTQPTQSTDGEDEDKLLDPEDDPWAVAPLAEMDGVMVYAKIAGQGVGEFRVAAGNSIPKTFKHEGTNYWIDTAVRNADKAELFTLKIPSAEQLTQDSDNWKDGVTVTYRRDMEIICGSNLPTGSTLELLPGQSMDLTFYANGEKLPSGGEWQWTLDRTDGDDILNVQEESPVSNVFALSGKAGKTEGSAKYVVQAKYVWEGEEFAADPFTFNVKVSKTAQGDGKDFYFILKVTDQDRLWGQPLTWEGLHIQAYDDGSFGFSFFDAAVLADHSLPLEEKPTEPTLPEPDHSGMTAAQIAQMRIAQEKKVKEQDLALRMAEAEYNIMQAEVNDGQVRADFEGQVVSVLTEEQARQEKKPLLKVSAGGGFYIEVSVSELEKENLQIGQEVTVSDWETGQTYPGKVESIGDFPTQDDGWNGLGNPNASYYPFVVFVDGEADLQAGRPASVTYATGSGESGIYLQNPFLRTENGESYVYVRGANGKLEKRTVTVGKSLWGSYTQITRGLTAEDYVAFPYGKEVRPGAPTAEGDLSKLYQ